jgi:N-acetylglucosaminyldiphosphoundecaprenol N-acetyl-beta-D-mannosaminyltransferase
VPPLAPPHVEIGGARVDRCTFQEATDWIIRHARTGGSPASVVTPNSHHIVLLQGSVGYREIYHAAQLSVADGMSLVWASRLLGAPLPERIGGVDLFEEVCRAAAGTDLRLFFLGGRPGAAEGAARVLRARYPGLLVAGTYCPPPGFERDSEESERVNRALRSADPDILFVGLGAPKQEQWIFANQQELGIPVAVGVGASLDFVSGLVPRAPRWMQRAGLEWLFRVIMEPRRLGRRYARVIPGFVWLVLRQYLRERPRTRSS